MEEKTRKILHAPFPKEVVQDPPKGKFGKFVNHAVYVERLRDAKVDYSWEFEPVIIDNKVIGAIGKLTIEGNVYQGAGDVEGPALARATLGECLKLAESDAFKRASMRAAIGVELWSGTDDYYDDSLNKDTKPKITKDKAETSALEKAKKDFAKDVEEQPNNAQQLNTFMTATISNEVTRAASKRDVYADVVSKGFPEEVEDWDDKQIEIFKDLVFETYNNTNKTSEVEMVEEIFGEVKDLTQNCPECGKSEYIEDNRQKKNDEPDKYGKIPSWSCSNYKDNDGCGWTGWGDTDCPTEWL